MKKSNVPWLRWMAIILLLAVALSGGVTILVRKYINPNYVRQFLETYLSEMLKASVKINSLTWDLTTPPSLEGHNLTITLPYGKELVSCKKFNIKFPLKPLLKDKTFHATIVMHQPHLTMRLMKNGVWEIDEVYSDFQRSSSTTPSNSKSEKSSTQWGDIIFEFENGTLSLIDYRSHNEPFTLDVGLDFKADTSFKQPFILNLSMNKLDGNIHATVNISTTPSIRARMHVSSSQLDFHRLHQELTRWPLLRTDKNGKNKQPDKNKQTQPWSIDITSNFDNVVWDKTNIGHIQGRFKIWHQNRFEIQELKITSERWNFQTKASWSQSNLVGTWSTELFSNSSLWESLNPSADVMSASSYTVVWNKPQKTVTFESHGGLKSGDQSSLEWPPTSFALGGNVSFSTTTTPHIVLNCELENVSFNQLIDLSYMFPYQSVDLSTMTNVSTSSRPSLEAHIGVRNLIWGNVQISTGHLSVFHDTTLPPKRLQFHVQFSSGQVIESFKLIDQLEPSWRRSSPQTNNDKWDIGGFLSGSQFRFLNLMWDHGTMNLFRPSDSFVRLDNIDLIGPVGHIQADVRFGENVTTRGQFETANFETLQRAFSEDPIISGQGNMTWNVSAQKIPNGENTLNGRVSFNSVNGLVAGFPGILKFVSALNLKSLLGIFSGKKNRDALRYREINAELDIKDNVIHVIEDSHLFSDTLKIFITGVIDPRKKFVKGQLTINTLSVFDEALAVIPGYRKIWSEKNKSIVSYKATLEGPFDNVRYKFGPETKLEKEVAGSMTDAVSTVEGIFKKTRSAIKK